MRIPDGSTHPSRWMPALVVVLGTACQPQVAAGQTIVTRGPDGREVKRTCSAVTPAKSLPAVSALIDSAAVLASLAAVAPPDAETWVLSLGYARQSSPARVRWVSPEAGPEDVLALVAERTAPGPRDVAEPWAVRLRFSFGGQPNVRVESAVFCPPIPVPGSGSGVGSGIVRVEAASGDRMPTPGTRIRLVTEARILESGGIVEARVVRGSGIRDLDDTALRHLQSMRFLPALLDGVPVEAIYRSDGTRIKG